MKNIADSGLLIALLDERDAHHHWARQVAQEQSPPWLVCESVLTEAAASIGTSEPLLEMLTVGDLELAFQLKDHALEVFALTKKYRDQQMDLADACVVRMTELFEDAVVYTVDKNDFTVYRRRGRQPIRCVFPP